MSADVVVAEKTPLWLDEDRSVTVSFRVPARLETVLERRARLFGRTPSAEARLALSVWLEGRERSSDGEAG
jgi:hypothetical protein